MLAEELILVLPLALVVLGTIGIMVGAVVLYPNRGAKPAQFRIARLKAGAWILAGLVALFFLIAVTVVGIFTGFRIR